MKSFIIDLMVLSLFHIHNVRYIGSEMSQGFGQSMFPLLFCFVLINAHQSVIPEGKSASNPKLLLQQDRNLLLNLHLNPELLLQIICSLSFLFVNEP